MVQKESRRRVMMVGAGLVGLGILANAASAQEQQPDDGDDGGQQPDDGDDGGQEPDDSPNWEYEQSGTARELALGTNTQSQAMHYRIESVGEIEAAGSIEESDEIYQDDETGLWVVEGQFGPAGTERYNVYATGLEYFGVFDLEGSQGNWDYTDTPTPVNFFDVSWNGSPADPTEFAAMVDVAEAEESPDPPSGGAAGIRHDGYEGPLGGGPGMPSNLTYSASDADYVESSMSGVQSAINSASPGDVVFVDGTVSGTLDVNTAVTLAGDRGAGGSSTLNLSGAMEVSAGGAEIAGLEIDRGAPSNGGAKAITVTARDVEIFNCEVKNAGYAGIEEPISNARLTIRQCHVHDCRRSGLGYGWQGHYEWTDESDQTVIEYCRFHDNRHHMSGAYCWYTARDNELGTLRHGSPNHCCEVRSNPQGAGNPTGNAVIAHNDVVADPGRVIAVRGTPTEGVWVENNRTRWDATPNDRGSCANSSGTWGSGCSILQPYSGTGGWDNVNFSGNEWGVL